MAKVMAAKLQEMAQEHPDQLARVLWGSLKGSYSSLTVERVRQAIDRWAAHEKAEGVIDMFVFGWLDDGIDD